VRFSPEVFRQGGYTFPGDLVVNGNVGIGIENPEQKLDVNGYIKGIGLCIGSDCRTT